MKIAIRVDASAQIGTGHLMRCQTLADALRLRGARTRFICRYLPKYLRDILASRDHELSLLANSNSGLAAPSLGHSHWLGTSQQADARESSQLLADEEWDWLVVDHYAVDTHWECALRKSSKRILVIDDIADRQHDCDILLDQNFYADMDTRYSGKVPEHCRLMLGPHYALLRDEFRQLRAQAIPRATPVKRVLVFFGGIDADNYTGRAIAALGHIRTDNLHVDVVIGMQHPYRAQIKSSCITHRFNCHVQTSNMAELVMAADMAIGAGGSATWERCCLGLPCLVVAVAQNQIQAAKALSDLGAVKLIGIAPHISVAKLIEEIETAISSNWIEIASKIGLELVDAQGTSRIVKLMENT